MTLNVMDLFSGAGGLSCGFQMAGHKIILGVDCDKDSCKTFSENHPDSICLEDDIREISETKIRDIIGKKRIDVVIGGPPCQGFSISGKRISSDPRNKLFLQFFRIMDMVKPKAILIENVPGLKGLYDGRIFRKIINELEKRKYKTFHKVLSADDFGVPQSRKRIFIVGLKHGYFEFPEPHEKKITLWESVSDLPLMKDELENTSYLTKPQNQYQTLMRKNSSILLNHVGTKHTEKTKKIIHMVPEGKNYKSLPKSLQHTRKVHIAWTRLDGGKPSLTIDTGHRHHFHPKADRVPTVRESARIQSFPDDFVFFGNKSSQYRQVGNAVPPLLAYHLGKSLVEVLNGKLQSSK